MVNYAGAVKLCPKKWKLEQIYRGLYLDIRAFLCILYENGVK